MTSYIKKYKNPRRYPRLNAKNIMSYSQCEGLLLGDLEGMAITKNIGLGGILVQIDHSFPIVGSYINIELAVHNSIIRAKGKIVHVRDLGDNRFDTGIQFVEISEDDVRLLRDYLEQSGATIAE